jgi:hypothetical protein
MQITDAPDKIVLPFADGGSKNVIPVTTNPTPGGASFVDGFPALTRTPKVSGGIPPFGLDMNGILYDTTAINRWAAAGAGFTYDSTFANDVNIGGYPAGSKVLFSDFTGYWVNTLDDNITDPEAGGAGWLPGESTGSTNIVMTASNVTLTSLQAAKNIIIITGVLTSNLNLIFPTYIKQWVVVNNCTGSFAITCKTLSGLGVAVNTGISANIYGDGTDIFSQSTLSNQTSGSFKNLQSSSTGLSALVLVSANELSFSNGIGNYVTGTSISLSIDTSTSGVNGLDTGSLSASTWYSVFAIRKADGTTDGLISLSSTSPTLPSGYTFFVRTGWIRTDATVNKYPLKYVQSEKNFSYAPSAGTNLLLPPVLASGTAGSPGTTLVSVSTTNAIPSTAMSISGFMSHLGGASSSSQVSPNNIVSFFTGNSVSLSLTGGNNVCVPYSFYLESSNIFWAASAGASSQINCIGWQDNL